MWLGESAKITLQDKQKNQCNPRIIQKQGLQALGNVQQQTSLGKKMLIRCGLGFQEVTF